MQPAMAVVMLWVHCEGTPTSSYVIAQLCNMGMKNVGGLYRKSLPAIESGTSAGLPLVSVRVFNLNLSHSSFCHYLRPQGARGSAVISSQSILCHISPV